jgi:thioredoxin-related protein
MKRIISLIALIVVVVITTLFASGSLKTSDITKIFSKNYKLPIYSLKYDPKRVAQEDLKVTILDAKEQNKRILMKVGGDWCPWCNAFDSFLIDNPDIKSLLYDNYVVLKVYTGPENYNRGFLSQFPRNVATPHFYVLDKEGKLLHSQTTEILEKGRSYDKLKVKTFLSRWIKK